MLKPLGHMRKHEVPYIEGNTYLNDLELSGYTFQNQVRILPKSNGLPLASLPKHPTSPEMICYGLFPMCFHQFGYATFFL